MKIFKIRCLVCNTVFKLWPSRSEVKSFHTDINGKTSNQIGVDVSGLHTACYISYKRLNK